MLDRLAQSRLDRARRGRKVTSERDLSLAATLKSTVKRDVDRAHRLCEKLDAAWIEFLPASLADRVGVLSMSAGVLVLEVETSGDKYSLERLLRGGVEKQIVALSNSRVRRVQVRIRASAPNAAVGAGLSTAQSHQGH